MEKNKDLNAFIGMMSILLNMRIPVDVILWLITITIFEEEEKSCLIDVAVEISEELKVIKEEELKENREKGFFRRVKRK